jgi:RNA polymerase sigma-70 factor (ECF subfamily)
VAQQARESQWVAGGIELAAHLAAPDELIEQQLEQERRAAVEAAIDDLPAQQQQCLLLRIDEEMSYEEIAGMLQISVNTVRNHLAEAKKNLRRMLASMFEEEIQL